MAKSGTLFVISGPSCSGKNVVDEGVMALDKGIECSVSATTRPARAGETPGKDYVFLDEVEFRRRIDADAFVEWAEVHGHLYGTLREELNRRLRSGKDVLLELDVQGMRRLKALRDDIVTVFIMAPSLDELERRMRRRGANDEADIAVRLTNARSEIAARHEYDHIIVNENVEEAVEALLAVVRERRAGTQRRP